MWPQPNATAAGEHMMHLLSFFKEMHYDILFVSAAQKPKNYCELDTLSIKTAQTYINDNCFDTLVKNYEPTVVLFDRFMTEEQFSWRVYNNCPQAVRILDTEDLHFLRNQRLEALKGKVTTELSDIFKREMASIYRSDLSLIISQKELLLLTKKYNIPKEILIYLPLLSQKKERKSFSFNERKDLIFVGNFLHQPNWNCVQYLKKEIWPKLSKKLPNIKLHIYGSHASEKHLQLSNTKERFLVHGYTNDLENKLQQSKILIAPIQFGAGQKGKLLKAMEFGLPSVTTSVGAEGMLFNDEWAGKISDNPTEIINETVALYNNKTIWQQAQDNCEKIIIKNFNYDTHFLIFKEKMSYLLNNLQQHRLKNSTGQILWHHSLRSTEFMSRWIAEKNKVKQ